MEPFHSRDAFRYIWLNWRVMGLHPFQRHKTLYLFYGIFINFIGAVLPTSSQIVQAFFVKSLGELIRNLSISLEWACGCFKHFVIIVWRENLQYSHHYLDLLDARVRKSPDEIEVMERIVKNCHRIYFMYNTSFWSTLTFFAINGIHNRRLVFEAYVPWDFEASTWRYIVAVWYQLMSSAFQLILNLAADAYAICYVYVLNGHLQTLAMRISRIGYDMSVVKNEHLEELINCVQDHRNILDFYDLIRPVISRTVLIQFMVTAFAFCLGAFYFVFFSSNLAMLLATLAYFGVLFAQVMPCCYFVNDLMIASDNLTTALYSCNWMDQDLKFRKTLIIFMQRTQKSNTIVAGNLAPVTLQTCLKILRFSFSMFTVLMQM